MAGDDVTVFVPKSHRRRANQDNALARPNQDNMLARPIWNPMDDLEVRDHISRNIRCLGFNIRNSRCCWDEVDESELEGQVPLIMQFLIDLSHKSPGNVTEQDLWTLVGLGVCGKHGSRQTRAMEGGLRDLQTKLSAIKCRTALNTQVVTRIDDREVAELRAAVAHQTEEATKHLSKCVELETQLVDSQKKLTATHSTIEGLRATCRLYESTIKALEEQAESFAKAYQEKNEIIQHLSGDVLDANLKIKELNQCNEHKITQLEEADHTREEREAELKRMHVDALAKQQSEFDLLLNTHDRQQLAYKNLESEHIAQSSQNELLREQLNLAEADLQDLKEHDRKDLSERQRLLKDQQASIEKLKEQWATLEALHDDQSKNYQVVKSLNDLLSEHVQDQNAKIVILDAEKEALAVQLQDLTAKRSRDWWCGLNRLFCLE